MNLSRFSNFLNENSKLKEIFVGVHTQDEAHYLADLLKRSGYKFIEDFNDELIDLYFNTYKFGEQDDGMFTFIIFLRNKYIGFRGITKNNFNILRDNGKSLLYPDDLRKITSVLSLLPTYTRRTMIYENNNLPKYIVMKIDNRDELNKVIQILKNSIDYTKEIHNRYELPNYLFIPSNLKENLDLTCPWLDSKTPNQTMIDSYIINADDTDGTYLTINDLGILERMLKGKHKPTYEPKKFVYENNFKILNSFNEFMILEGVDDSVPFIISQRLEDLLKKINHPIAKELINLSANDDGYSDEATLIDLDEIDDDKFIYTISNKYKDAIQRTRKDINPESDKSKIYDFIKTNSEIYYTYPSSIRIGRLINKLFPNKYNVSGTNNSIESFVDAVISKRKEKYKNIDIVNGQDIIKYYDEKSYNEDAFNGSELGNSCMRYEHCSEYIEFYAENPDVQLVILRNSKDKSKINARALLWKIEYNIGKKEKTGYFLDRIYFTKRYQKNILIEYAKKKLWFYKKEQNSRSDTPIWDPTLNFTSNWDFKTVPTFKKSSTGKYPYLDTLKYFYVDRGFLSNTMKFKEGDETVYALEDTDGRYSIEENGVYISYYNDYINEDDLVYCEYGDDMRLMDDAIYLPDENAFATEEYAKQNCFFDESGYCILKSKAVKYIDSRGKEKYTSKKHALDNFYYSTIDNKFHEIADASDEYNTYIPSNKSIKVYLDSNIKKILKGEDNNTDYYIIDDGKYFKYLPKNNRNNKPIVFSNKVKNDFVLVTTNFNNNNKEYYHKKYDRNKFVKYDNEYITKEMYDLIKKGK